MFIIGKANESEIATMKKQGFDVEDVDVLHFDLALNPDLDVGQSDEDRYEKHGDKLVSIFLDCDISQECRSIYEKEQALQIKKLQYELSQARDKKMDDVWIDYDLGLTEIGFEFADDDGWEHDSRDPNEYSRNFYATPIDDPDADSTKFHFIIRFHPNESRVLETIVRDQRGEDVTCGGEV